MKRLPGQFCTSRNNSVDLSKEQFFVKLGKNKYKESPWKEVKKSIKRILEKSDPENVETIDGGPNCFGDSGEPFNSRVFL